MSEATLRLNRGTQPRQHDRAGAKRKLNGHEVMLQKLKDEGAIVAFVTIMDDRLEGKILNFDKYTVTILMDGEECCMFKHAIACFAKKD